MTVLLYPRQWTDVVPLLSLGTSPFPLLLSSLSLPLCERAQSRLRFRLLFFLPHVDFVMGIFACRALRSRVAVRPCACVCVC